MESLRVRKLADRDGEDRVKVTDPVTGIADLYTPEDAAELIPALKAVLAEYTPTPYPLAGIEIEDPPDHVAVPEGYVASAKAEGWVTTVPESVEQPVIRSTGPPENPWGPPPHTFIHYEQVIFHTIAGDLVYDVAENPDKWPDDKDGAAGFGGDVCHFYELKLKEIVTPPEEAESDG